MQFHQPAGSIRSAALLGFSWGAALTAVAAVYFNAAPSTPWTALPQTALWATATDNDGQLAVATGLLEDDNEGVFFLDPLTGQLQCWAIGGARRQVMPVAGYGNVYQDIGLEEGEKNPRCLMVTGQARFQGAAGNAQMSRTVVYVVNSKTGIFAVYGVPRVRPDHAQNPAALQLLGKAKIRPEIR